MEDLKSYKEKLKWKLNFGEKRVKSFGGKANKETLVLVGNICLESLVGNGNQCHVIRWSYSTAVHQTNN